MRSAFRHACERCLVGGAGLKGFQRLVESYHTESFFGPDTHAVDESAKAVAECPIGFLVASLMDAKFFTEFEIHLNYRGVVFFG